MPAFAVVGASLSSSTVSSAAVSPLTVTVTGLASGATILVEHYVDLNGDGLVGAGDLLAQSATVTDGAVFAIGGVRNVHVPGDDDGIINSQITLQLALATGSEIGRLAGLHLIRLSSPVADFSPFTRPLTVTNPSRAQTLGGTVRSGGTPVPFALVLLFQEQADDTVFVLGGQADASGNYTLPVGVGDYHVVGLLPGYVADFHATTATITNGVNASAQVVLIPASRTLSGKIADTATAVGLPGATLFIQSEAGLTTIVSTAANGNYTAAVTAGIWEVEIAENSLVSLGYFPLEAVVTADTTTGNVSGLNINFPKVNALVSGHVTTPTATPAAQIRLYAHVEGLESHGDTSTDASGLYVVGLLAGTAHIGVSSDNLEGYLAPSGQSITLAAGQAATLDFTLQAVTAHVQGVVKTTGNVPVSGIRLSVYKQNSNQSAQATTAADGTFDLGLAAGTWTVQIESDSAEDFNVIGPGLSYTLLDGQTLTNITVVVATPTARITGLVRDSSLQPVANATVHGTAHVGDTDFVCNAGTDGSGQYSLPVIDGIWTVSVFTSDSGSAPSQAITITGADQTLNFTLSHAPQIGNPSNQAVTAGQTFVFFVSTQSSGPVTYQWQVSINGGSSWSNLTEAAPYATVTSNVLNVTANAGLHGYQYRCIAASVAYPGETTTSNAATLTILTTFTAFRTQYFMGGELDNPAISGPVADPDGDGLVNLLEFAFNLPPKTANTAALPVLGASNGRLTLTYVRRKDVSLNYTIEVTSTLGAWQAGSGFTEEIGVVPIDSQTERVTVRDLSLQSANPRRFMRLQVNVP